MFIYRLTSRVDRIDSYWYARLMGLKAAYIATGMFIANLILRPASPSLVILFSSIGALLGEMPSMNTLDKKDNIFLAWVILVTLTVAIFSTTGFMQLPFLMAVGAWAYFLYYMLRKKPETFAIVSALLMMGAISQEGPRFGNYFMIWDTTLFVFEFSLIAFWLHKLFPFMYHKIWLSSLLRSLETLLALLYSKDIEKSKALRKHSMVSLSALNLLVKRKYFIHCKTIHGDISALHFYFYKLIYNFEHEDVNLTVAISDIEYLYQAIKNQRLCDLTASQLSDAGDGFYCDKLSELIINWNQLCQHVNS